MRSILAGIGIVVFWLAWPFWWVYFPLSERTRLLLVCDGKILVLKGWLGTGWWILPGGGLHKNEDKLRGLLREVNEETGIVLSPKQVRPLLRAEFRQTGLHFMCNYFVAELHSRPTTKKQVYEIRELAWMRPEALQRNQVSVDVVTALRAYDSGIQLG